MRPFPSLNMRGMRGLSLVELMIAMTIGLATVGAVGYVYLGTSQTYRSQDAVARLQEGARYAFELIGNDLRMTGATGCSMRTSVNVITNFAANWWTNVPGQPLLGLDEDGVAGVTEFSDALAVLHADISREYIVQAHNPATAQFTIDGGHDLTAGGLLLATDCDHVAVFAASAAGAPTVSHAASAVNSVPELGEGGVARTYPVGSRLYRLSATTYYVANNPAGEPALYRTRLDGAGALNAEELVEGVEDIQFSYGVDTTEPDADNAADFDDPDGDGDPYMSAAQVDSAAVPGATAEERWARVVSVRVSLLMRTVENNVMPEQQTYSYNGADVQAADRRLRKVFTHVIKVRNR